MNEQVVEKIEAARLVLESLLQEYKTASFATVLEDGAPHVSYSPVALDAERNFYLFVSELSLHTRNLRERGFASLMLLEDEAESKQLFARCRLTVDGQARHIARASESWEHAAEVYRARFGKFFEQLSQLSDFHMFVLKPVTARLVVGFGQAYTVGLPDWTDLELLSK